jgi:AcrR family transcriptional regulator
MPISDCEVRDPRIRRTRQLLQGALRSLMQSKNIDEISVQDITEAATVNRATFYDHYTDKYALLDALIASGFHMMLHERNVSFDGTCPSAARAIILATCDYITQIHANPAECSRQNAFEPLIEAAITTAIRYVIIKGMPKESAPTNLSPEIIATATSWAIYGAVKQWFYTPDHVPPEEIVPQILKLIVPILMVAGPIESPAESLAHSS